MADVLTHETMAMEEVYTICSSLIAKSVRKTVCSDAISRPGGSNVSEERGEKRAREAVEYRTSYKGAELVAKWARATLLVSTGLCGTEDQETSSVRICVHLGSSSTSQVEFRLAVFENVLCENFQRRQCIRARCVYFDKKRPEM